MTPLIILVTGIPRAGKSSFADVVEQSSLSFSHIPLDKYIMQVPSGETFLRWVKESSCIDWKLLMDHLDLLFSGQACFTPKPDWSQSGRRISEGGAINFGPGRKMIPNKRGYVIAGTHAYFMPERQCKRVKVYINTPYDVIASRLEGHRVSLEKAGEIIRKHLGDNPNVLDSLKAQADLLIDGDATPEKQVEKLKMFLTVS